MAEEQGSTAPYFGEYRVIGKIGCGGFGCVHLCQHPRLSRRVAIKSFNGNAESEEECQKFLQEAHLLERLEHKCIVRLEDVGVKKSNLLRNVPYLVMEFAPNGSLRDMLEKRRQPFRFEEALPILVRIGEALQYAHKKDVLHRDVKPENILFDKDGQALLADFGIAVVLSSSSTKHGNYSGTVTYMAPEQFRGDSHRHSDQYALACVAYEMLTGKPPFVRETKDAFMHAHLHDRPNSLQKTCPDIPPYIDQAILKALRKEHKHRYHDVKDFLHALQVSPAPRSPIVPSKVMEDVIWEAPRAKRPVRDQPDDLFSELPRTPRQRERQPQSRWSGSIPRRAMRQLGQRNDVRAEEEILPINKKRIPERFRSRVRLAPLLASTSENLNKDNRLAREIRKQAEPATRHPVRPPTPAKTRTSHDWSVIGAVTCFFALFLAGHSFENIGFFQFLLIGSGVCTCIYSIWLSLRCLFIGEIGWGMFFALVWIVALILVSLFHLPLVTLFFLSLGGCLLYGWFHADPARKPEAPKRIRRNQR